MDILSSARPEGAELLLYLKSSISLDDVKSLVSSLPSLRANECSEYLQQGGGTTVFTHPEK